MSSNTQDGRPPTLRVVTGETPPKRVDPTWSLEIFRMSGPESQQSVLGTLQRIGRPGVTALGTDNGGEWFVIVEAGNLQAEIAARRVVRTLDPRAERTHTTRASDRPWEREPS